MKNILAKADISLLRYNRILPSFILRYIWKRTHEKNENQKNKFTSSFLIFFFKKHAKIKDGYNT